MTPTSYAKLRTAVMLGAGVLIAVNATPATAQNSNNELGSNDSPVVDRESLDGQSLLPLEASSRPMAVTDGDGEGRALELEITQAPDDGASAARWEIRMGDLNTVAVHRNDAGDVMIDSLEIVDKGMRVMYDPPVPLLRADLRPERENVVESHARILDAASGELKYEGPVRHAINLVTSATLQLPAGRTDVTYVGIHHIIDLDNAKIDAALEQGYKAGVGIVYRRLRTTIEKPMWMGSTVVRAIEATELPEN